jgi:leucyl aminopeptidase
MNRLEKLTTGLGDTGADRWMLQCNLPAVGADAESMLRVACTDEADTQRVAWRGHLPGLFYHNESCSEKLIGTVGDLQDPLWRLPVWNDYDRWLSSSIADSNNVSNMPHFAAIVAALFLRRFMNPETLCAIIDFYAWNDQSCLDGRRVAKPMPNWRHDRHDCAYQRPRLEETNCNWT